MAVNHPKIAPSSTHLSSSRKIIEIIIIPQPTFPPVITKMGSTGGAHVYCNPPQAILFDMDGVMADVSKSYRAAIIQVKYSKSK